MNVSGECVSAIPLHNDRKYSDLPEPDVPITTEWKPKPPKSLARKMTYCSSPPGLTPTGTIAHFAVAATTAFGPQPVDVEFPRIVDTQRPQ